MNLTFVILFLSIFVSKDSAFAAVKPNSSEERMRYLQEAQVWSRPAWVDSQFNFDSKLKLPEGPVFSGFPKIKPDQQIKCRYLPQAQTNGKTPKFHCEIDWNGKREKVKIKYGAENGELFAEVAASRLLWALGFKADGVFPVRTVLCEQCPSQDPFRNPNGQTGDYTFQYVTLERKFPGSKIEQTENQGWGWDEILKGYEAQNLASLSGPDLERKLMMKTHRDALRLLAVFLQHADNKPEQQRLVCEGSEVNGQCQGQTGLVIQDLGATFGGGSFGILGNITPGSKMNSNEWAKMNIWKNPGQCQSNMSKAFVGSSSLVHPIISEEGRLFLGKLLQGFTAGSAGRLRLSQLFEISRADYRMVLINNPGLQQITSQQMQIENQRWVSTFMKKVGEVSSQNLRCPVSIFDLK